MRLITNVYTHLNVIYVIALYFDNLVQVYTMKIGDDNTF